jgi:hypothetical protein
VKNEERCLGRGESRGCWDYSKTLLKWRGELCRIHSNEAGNTEASAREEPIYMVCLFIESINLEKSWKEKKRKEVGQYSLVGLVIGEGGGHAGLRRVCGGQSGQGVLKAWVSHRLTAHEALGVPCGRHKNVVSRMMPSFWLWSQRDSKLLSVVFLPDTTYSAGGCNFISSQ